MRHPFQSSKASGPQSKREDQEIRSTSHALARLILIRTQDYQISPEIILIKIFKALHYLLVNIQVVGSCNLAFCGGGIASVENRELSPLSQTFA